MTNTYETFAPLFPGFYCTVFEANEESEIYNYNHENGTNYDYDNFEWDYEEYETRVSKAFVARLEKEINAFLPVKLEYQGLHSPKEYNFKNDSINIAVELDLQQLLKLIEDRKAWATKYFKDKYTSRSGFISFHSNDIKDWINEAYILENPGHRIGALLNCLCFCEINQNDIIYWCEDEIGYINYTVKEQETID